MMASLVLSLMMAIGSQLAAPTGHVNDRAGVFSPAERDALETRLRDFEAETSVEIAVLVVTSLGGEAIEPYTTRVFNAWGVGKEGLDNGVLLVVAVDDRRLRIETGYGFESDLTDVQARRIIDRTIVPHFQADAYDAGMRAGVDAIIETLGNTAWADRVETRRLLAAEREREREEWRLAVRGFFGKAGMVLAGGAGLALLAACYVSLRRALIDMRRKMALRTTLRDERIPDTRAKVAEARRSARRALANVRATIPAAIVRAHAGVSALAIDQGSEKADADVERAERLLRRNVDEAAAAIQSAERRIATLRRTAADLDRTYEEYRAAQAEAPRTIDAARKRTGRVRRMVKELVERGYRLNADDVVAGALAELAKAEASVSHRDFVEAGRRAARATGLAEEARERMRDFVPSIERTHARLDAADQLADDLMGDHYATATAVLETLVEEYPELVWKPVRAAVRDVPQTAETVREKLAAARGLAGMDAQEFDRAARVADEVERMLNSLATLLGRPATLIKAQESARKAWPEAIRDVRGAQDRAAVAAQRSGVPNATRRELEKLDDQLAILEGRSDEARVDWVSVVEAANALGRAYEALRKKAKRQAKKRNAQRRSGPSTTARHDSVGGYTTGTHTGGGGVGSGGGFGGFGGGMSGGGGASGRW